MMVCSLLGALIQNWKHDGVWRSALWLWPLINKHQCERGLVGIQKSTRMAQDRHNRWCRRGESGGRGRLWLQKASALADSRPNLVVNWRVSLGPLDRCVALSVLTSGDQAHRSRLLAAALLAGDCILPLLPPLAGVPGT